jgi:hypothetical protein
MLLPVLGSRSRGAEIKMPPGAGARTEITNSGSGSGSSSGSLLFIEDLKKFYLENHGYWRNVF